MKTDDIFKLLKDRKVPKNLTGREFLNVSGEGEKRASLYLYDEISYWSYNDADTFRQRLASIDADVIDLHINSPGGSVFEGVAIYNLLLAHKARVIVHIDGLAASIASVIALAGDEIHIAENAMVMIHNPTAMVWGEAEDCRKMADSLEAVKAAILNTYESRTNLDRSALDAAMTAETWYGADEAVANGFASQKVAAQKIAARWNAGDFELPESARQFGNQAKPSAEPPPATPAAFGTVADVLAAREKFAHLTRHVDA